MIDEIQVENVALIRAAHLVPARGLTVLTGETGAGKTALLSALKLLMGERADKSIVREGADALSVSGRFFVKDGEDQEIAEGNEVVAVRRVTADGRSRVTINGGMASVGELAQSVAPSIDLCGQHEHQRLLKPSEHVHMLDLWARDAVAEPLSAYCTAYDQAQQAKAELMRVQEAAQSSSLRLDEARFTLRQIDAIDPQEGEYDDLSAELARAENAEALASATQTAYQELSGDGGALDALGNAAAALEGAARFDESLGALAESLREASYAAEDAARDIRSYRDSVEFDPELLEQKQERMAALQGLLRTYGPTMDQVLLRRAEAADLVSMVDDAEERLRAAQMALDLAEEVLAQAAETLANARSAAAPQFSDAVTAQMARLEMGSAQLECRTEDLPREQWTRDGSQSVEFLFRPGAGMQARPLARIASGGEVSRVMLAVKVVLGQSDDVDTLVFDEVDAGVGGATAQALADVLADLASTHQVIVVTHLAQVAVKGQVHYAVRKTESDQGVPETHLIELGEKDRPTEIARMLSGEITETSLAHARELLGGCGE